MSLTMTAYAKINLTLEALASREDGYHEIASVMQTITLADTLSLELSDTLDLRCNDVALQSAANMVLKAAEMLNEAVGQNMGASIILTKGIPTVSGLGSGSTDAAAALIGLNNLWGLNLTQTQLADVGAKLGSDVTFFIYGGTALMTGRGEKIKILPSLSETWLVLFKPQIECGTDKTAYMYSQLRPHHFTSGSHTELLVERIREGKSIDDSLLFNVFEYVIFDVYPELSEYRSRFLATGVKSVHIAGSGPSLFAFVRDQDDGEAIINALKNDGIDGILVRTINTTTK